MDRSDKSTSDPKSAIDQGLSHFETQALTRKVGNRNLVDNVSIAVNRGEILAVSGPSGAGKSSFLRLLNRLDEPTGGTVFMEGRDYRQIATSTLRRCVGMVLQNANLFLGTVAQNLSFGPAQRKQILGSDEIEELLIKVDLAGYAARDVTGLSGGEAQRVSFARTLANNPSILLLDEPTSALDEESGRVIEKLILRISQEQKITCIVVTHNPPQAVRLSKRMMYMADGKVAAIGSTKEVLYAHRAV